MASRPTVDARSGGKILRNRRRATSKSPYARPPPPPPPPPVPENPRWLTGLIYPATRILATGASKLVSTVFGSDTSSSSSSASDADLSSEDDDDDGDNVYDDISPRGASGLDEKNVTTEIVNFYSEEPISVVEKSESKQLIEQLLMRETFSRMECDRLIEIIKSRVVDQPTIKEAGNWTDSGTVWRDMQMPDLCSTAVREAKKWLEEKKTGSSSKSELNYRTCTLNSAMQLPVSGEVGSPVDMAKSYMRARPTWASSSPDQIDTRSPLPSAIQLYKEETPFSFGGNSLSSSQLKRNTPATGGSWNIREEIRRVRSKATEDMLASPPSMKLDLCAFNVEDDSFNKSLSPERIETNPGDVMAIMIAGDTSCDRGAVTEVIQQELRTPSLPSNPAISVSELDKDVEASLVVDENGGLRGGSKEINSLSKHQSSGDGDAVKQSAVGGADDFTSIHGSNLEQSSMIGELKDSRSNDRNRTTPNDTEKTKAKHTANGFPSTEQSLGEKGFKTEANTRPLDEKLATGGAHIEESCELLSETFIEVPTINETEGITNGSQDSPRVHIDDLSSDLNPNNSNATTVDKQQPVRKSTRYSRKITRGKGK